ncbi:hypothetical protein BCV70DRAFT_63583 [Testicularia cyperi]|uniref:Uncharacterized protein n=1 Tax=Testicularia cyperi TaxID=1882483 RepID=A0A317XVQ4_9BASI|nr:hypothetical protein BCV70DRAFT_63583 [Testicularia cyperi]
MESRTEPATLESAKEDKKWCGATAPPARVQQTAAAAVETWMARHATLFTHPHHTSSLFRRLPASFSRPKFLQSAVQESTDDSRRSSDLGAFANGQKRGTVQYRQKQDVGEGAVPQKGRDVECRVLGQSACATPRHTTMIKAQRALSRPDIQH